MTLIEETVLNWETLYCPHRDCRCYGKPFKTGLMVKNGSSRGEPQARCNACGGSVTLSYGTAYYGLQADRAIFEMAVRALAEGNALRAPGRSVQAATRSLGAAVDRLARHCPAVMPWLWRDLHVRECQLGVVWSFVPTKGGHLRGAKRYCGPYGDACLWVAFAP